MPARRRHHCHAPNRSVPCPTGMPPRSAAPAIVPSGARSPRTRAAVVDRGPTRETQTGIEGQGWNHAEIDRSDGVCMVAQECSPSLRWRPPAPDHILRNRRLGDLEPELEQFTMDARGAPQWVLLAHPLDEFAKLTANSGPPWPTARFQ